jgi:hypothetical protein
MFKNTDRVRIIAKNSMYTGTEGTIVNVYTDDKTFLVKLDTGNTSGFFVSELELSNPLITLAETLDEARRQANAIPETESWAGVYGDIANTLIKVLSLITDSVIDGRIVYDGLLDGNTVREALALSREV